MVPMLALPPATPFTDQLTAVLFVPVTVAVNTCWLPERIMPVAGDTCTTMPFTCAVIAAETLDPGAGFCTVMFTLPTCASVAVPVAVNCVEEITVVVSAVVPIKTVAPGAKCKPVRVNVKGPTGMTIGETVLSCGTGLSSVTALLPVLLASTLSVALIVMMFAVGGNSGAVNMPVASIVPVVAFPPATPFTNQARFGREPSFAFAVNCCVVSPGSVAEAGVTITR